MRAGTRLARPEWAVQIERLRERLHLNQAGLARLLNVSPMAVSRWERAVNEPEAAYYIHMGTLSGDPDCWYFWQRAGLPASDLKRALRKSKSSKSPQSTVAELENQSVPLLGVWRDRVVPQLGLALACAELNVDLSDRTQFKLTPDAIELATPSGATVKIPIFSRRGDRYGT